MKKVLILSGAGISAESGIRTFREIRCHLLVFYCNKQHICKDVLYIV